MRKSSELGGLVAKAARSAAAVSSRRMAAPWLLGSTNRAAEALGGVGRHVTQCDHERQRLLCAANVPACQRRRCYLAGRRSPRWRSGVAWFRAVFCRRCTARKRLAATGTAIALDITSSGARGCCDAPRGFKKRRFCGSRYSGGKRQCKWDGMTDGDRREKTG